MTENIESLILEQPDPIAEQLGIIDEGYPILLATSINIQPWVFEEASLWEPEKHRASHLLRAVRREGVRGWEPAGSSVGRNNPRALRRTLWSEPPLDS